MQRHSMLRPVRRPFLAAIVLLAGCGGGPSDTEQVHATVEAFGRATAAKDYPTLCDQLLSPKLIEKLESVGLPCEVALKQGLGDVQAPTLTIGAIDVDGRRDGPGELHRSGSAALEGSPQASASEWKVENRFA